MHLNALNLSLASRALFGAVRPSQLIFTTAPSISPGIGTAGSTTFTGTDGVVPNGSVTAREWLLNDVLVATGGTFAPTTAQSGTLTYRNWSGSGLYSTSAPVTISATVSNQMATFGALTASGATGFRPLAGDNTEVLLANGSTPTLLSGSLGSYTPSIEGGRLTFRGAAGAPNGAVLRCALAAGGTVDLQVNTVANAYTVGTFAEFNSFLGLSSATKSGKTCIVRVVDDQNSPTGYGLANVNWSGRFLNLTSRVYIRGEKPTLPPIVGTGGVFTSPNAGGQPQGNVEFTYLHWRVLVGMESKLTGNIDGPSFDMFTVLSDASDVRIANCIFSSDVVPARLTGMRPKAGKFCLNVNGSNITVEDNLFTNFVRGANLGGTNIIFRRNELRNWFDDPMRVNPLTGQSVSNILVENNLIYDCIGDNGYHPDMIHMYGTDLNIDGVTVVGNVFTPGTEGVLSPPWLTNKSNGAYVRETSLWVGERVLTGGDTNKMIFVDARTTPSAITLPALSTVGNTANIPDYCIQMWFKPGSPVTITPAAGDILYDGNSFQNVQNVTLEATWETVQIWLQTSPSKRWAVSRSVGSYQGVFTNTIDGSTGGGIGNVSVKNNIIWQQSNSVRDSNSSGSPWSVLCNSFLPLYSTYGKESNYFPQLSSRIIETSKNAGYAIGNIASSITGFTGGSELNVLATELDLNNSFPAVLSAFSVSDPTVQRWMATGRMDAITQARPKLGGALPSGMGAGLSQDPANDYYNFGQFPEEPLGYRTNKPWEVVRFKAVVKPGGADLSWGEPPDVGGFGAVTGYDCQYSLDGSTWNALPVAGTTASIRYLAIGAQPVFRARALNANGPGCWYTLPPVTITEFTPGDMPAFSVLSTSSVASQSDKLESSSFAVSAGKSHIIAVTGRMLGPSSTSVAIANATIGAAGRAFGTGTPLTPVEAQSLIGRVDVEFLFSVAGLSSAANQTVQVAFVDSTGAAYKGNGITFQVLEITGARSSGMIGAKSKVSTSNQATLSLPLTTGYDRSLVLGFAALGNGSTVSTSGFDAIITQQNPNGPTTTASASRAVATAGAITQSFTWGLSGAPSSAIIIEVLAAPA